MRIPQQEPEFHHDINDLFEIYVEMKHHKILQTSASCLIKKSIGIFFTEFNSHTNVVYVNC